MVDPRIPMSEITIEFARSSGPGGQNVNKTSTKAQLRWHLWSSNAVTGDEKRLIAERLSGRLTDEGFIAIDVSESRSQLQNKLRALELLDELIQAALLPVIPRRPTRPPRRSKIERLKIKRQRGTIKKLRKSVADE